MEREEGRELSTRCGAEIAVTLLGRGEPEAPSAAGHVPTGERKKQ